MSTTTSQQIYWGKPSIHLLIATVLVAGLIPFDSAVGLAQVTASKVSASQPTTVESSEFDKCYLAITELHPQAAIPQVDHLMVRRVDIHVTEADVDQAVENLLQQNGAKSVDAKLLKDLGFATVQELRHAMRAMIESAVTFDMQESLRLQVENYLSEHSKIELPREFLTQNANVAMSRQKLDLMLRGIPSNKLKDKLPQDAGADEKNARELKLYFILRSMADTRGIKVKDADIEKAVAAFAFRFGYDAQKLKEELSAAGMLSALTVRVREQMTVDSILQTTSQEVVHSATRP